MTSSRIICGALVALILGCRSEPKAAKEPTVAQVFPTLPLPANPELVSRSGSADGLQITVRSGAEFSNVAGYYRRTLSSGNWRLMSDVKSPDSSIALYAEQNGGPPLWVRIWKAGEGNGTMVQLTGVVLGTDSLKTKRDSSSKQAPTRTEAGSRQSGSSMSTKRSQRG
jgi:hypothetical protein